jgi:phosphoenolpyruvate carboxylase
MPNVSDATMPPVDAAPAPVPLLTALAADLDEAQREERVLRRAAENPRAAATWDDVHRAARRRQQLQDELDQMRRGLARSLAALPALRRAVPVAQSALDALIAHNRQAEAKARQQKTLQAVEEMQAHIARLAGLPVPEEG